jgi:hypothetical protein
MKILFLTNFFPNNNSNIYSDLIFSLNKNKHLITVLVSDDQVKETTIECKENLRIIRYPNGKYYNVNLLYKFINFLLLPLKTRRTIKRFLLKDEFDLLLYHNPPITLYSSIKYLLKNLKINKTFLMQKDFFPQNAVDLGLINRRSILNFYFRRLEKKLFMISTFIGVMSKKNKEYLLKKNNFINHSKVIIFPNTKLMNDMVTTKSLKENFPINIFYGGNLGLPQNVNLFLKVLLAFKNDNRFNFIVSGRGTHKKKVIRFSEKNKIFNIDIKENLTRNDYLKLLENIDLSLVTLDYRFTIPNYPSRILDFIDYYIPILFASDPVNDLTETIKSNKIGFTTYSNNYINIINLILKYKDLVKTIDLQGFSRLKKEFSVQESVQIIESILNT